MEAAPPRGNSGRSPISECPRSFLESIPSPIAPAPPGSLGYVITKEHVEEMRRTEKMCEAIEEKLHREYKPVFLPVDEYLNKEINCELINVDIRSYPWKNTPFGDVYYSPRYNDDRYTYRHVLLTNGVRKEAERVAATVPGGLLTEEVFVHYLGIVLSSGWSHFMLFNKQFKELILRRPKDPDTPATGEEATRIRDGAPGPNDEIDSDSGDDEEQRAAILLLKEKEAAERDQAELERQRQTQSAETITASTENANEGEAKELSKLAGGDTLDVRTVECITQTEKENIAAPPDLESGSTNTEKAQPSTCLPSALHRRKPALTKANSNSQGSQALEQQQQQQQQQHSKNTSESSSHPHPVQGRARGGTVAGVVRRRDTAALQRAAASRTAAANRGEPSEPSGQAATAQQQHGTSADDPGAPAAAAAGAAAAEHKTAKNAAAPSRPQPKVAARRVRSTAITKADTRMRQHSEEKETGGGVRPAAAAAASAGGKRNLEGGAAVQDKNKLRRRRL